MFRKEIKDFKAYAQGKPIEKVMEEYGISEVEKLASNENHFGISKTVKEKIIKEIDQAHLYPDGAGTQLKKELLKKFCVLENQIVLGTGGEQILLLLALSMLDKEDNIVVPKPTFDLYKMFATLMGAKTKEIPLEKNFMYDIKKMLDAIDEKTKMIFITTPNNPTGNILTKEELKEIIEKVPENVLVVLDEAYFEFAAAFDEYEATTKEKLDMRENIFILRTFSKIYALAGLRIGYGFTNEKIAEKMNAINLTFGRNRLAETAAIQALKEDDYLNMVQEKNKEGLQTYMEFFDSKNLDYVKPFGNFIWVDVQKNSKTVFEELQKKGIIIRPGYHWGFDTHIRISTGTPKQNAKCIEELEKIL